MVEEDSGFVLLEVSRIESGTNRKIYRFQCNFCHEVFNNHKNAKKHTKKCKMKHKKQKNMNGPIDQYFALVQKTDHEKEDDNEEIDFCEQFGYPDFVPFLMNLIAECNIPFTQMDHPAWKEFIYSLNTDVSLPCSQTVKSAFLQYADSISQQSLQDMKNSICGIAVDGSTYREKTLLCDDFSWSQKNSPSKNQGN